MILEFDLAKDAINRAKHGVSLAASVDVFENCFGTVADDREEYGELRFNAFGILGDRLFVCTYTKRGEAFRVISLRRANKKEQRTWQL